jgi:cobalt-precorrin 5A hydrolase
MRIALVSFTGRGGAVRRKIERALAGNAVETFEGTGGFGSLGALVAGLFENFDALVFVCAAGIAVRGVAPYIAGKDRDPAVLVAGEDGRFIVPILSGHIGGANKLAAVIAAGTGATAVITTATDINGIVAFDDWAARNDCAVADISEIRFIAKAQLRRERIGFKSDFPVRGALPEGVVNGGGEDNGVVLSVKSRRRDFPHTLQLIPRRLHLGFGCRRGADPAAALAFIRRVFADNDLSTAALRSLASIDLKADEPALSYIGRELGIPVTTYTAKELAETRGDFAASGFVRETTGVDNVCERAAARAARGRIALGKTAGDGVTAAAAIEAWEAVF